MASRRQATASIVRSSPTSPPTTQPASPPSPPRQRQPSKPRRPHESQPKARPHQIQEEARQPPCLFLSQHTFSKKGAIFPCRRVRPSILYPCPALKLSQSSSTSTTTPPLPGVRFPSNPGADTPPTERKSSRSIGRATSPAPLTGSTTEPSPSAWAAAT